MRVGVIGCGYWGSNHLRLMKSFPEVSQVVVVEPHTVTRTRLAKQPDLQVFAEVAEALPHIDAAIIATPPQTHAPIALQCLRSGVPVLVEKPLATTSRSAEQLIGCAADGGLTLMVGHTFEYNSAVRKLRELVVRGEFGDIYFIDTARLNLGLFQSDVNVIWDLAPHDISILNYILGAEPDAVQAWGSAQAKGALEDVATLRLEYAALGVSAQINVSWLAPQKVRRVTVVGSSKMAVYDDLLVDERIRIFDKGVVPASDTASPGGAAIQYRNGGISSPFLDFQEPLKVLDQHFLDAVRFGHPVLTPGESGLAIVRVIEAAQASLAQGAARIRLTPSAGTLDLREQRLLVTGDMA